MLLKIDPRSFQVEQQGWDVHASNGRTIYTSPGLRLSSVAELADCPGGQAVEIDPRERTVSFGRDYLGKHPLAYAATGSRLFIGDEVSELTECVRADGTRLSVSERALALYFTAGYVPQGMTLYEQVHTCENVSWYRWRDGKVSQVSLFEPVEISGKQTISAVADGIRDEVSRVAGRGERVDIWCSGGLDSSSMAQEFREQELPAELVTLGYGSDVADKFGTGEASYAEQMAAACDYKLRYADLDGARFRELHGTMVAGHISPVIDNCGLAKYALASLTRDCAVTGEGGDPVFGGVKNDFMVYNHSRDPGAPLGNLYAIAHKRFFGMLKDLFRRGEQLQDEVRAYFQRRIDRYPGDLVRKLFYLNAIDKQGGMIFPEAYYPAKRFGIKVEHPLTSLQVYRQAFRLPDEMRYVYPKGKLALLELYRDRLPPAIIERKKSGTIVPIQHYVREFPEKAFDFAPLKSLDVFNEKIFESIGPAALRDTPADQMPYKSALLIYAFVTLGAWLNATGGQHARLSA